MRFSETKFFRRSSVSPRENQRVHHILQALRDVYSHRTLAIAEEASRGGIYAQDLLVRAVRRPLLSRVLLANSGLWRFIDAPGRARAYEIVWVIGFGACGASCLANVPVAAAPYHTMPMSLFTAYIHVPAYQGFRFWRRTLNSRRSSGLVETLLSQESAVVTQALDVIEAGIVLTALSQIFLVVVVWCAYALPAQPLGDLGRVAPRVGASLLPVAAVRAHGLIMWALVAIVVFCIVGQYALFALYSYLHWIEVALCGERMVSLLARHYDDIATGSLKAEACDDDDDDDDDDRDSGGDGVRLGETPGATALRRLRPVAEAEAGRPQDFDALLEAVARECRGTQQSLDRSCEAWDSVLLHYFALALAQILVVLNHVKLHTVGASKDRSYAYCFFFQDAFFVASGSFIIAATIVCAASVTSKCNEIHSVVRKLAYKRDTTFRAATLSNVISDHLTGMSCFGHPVDKQKCVMIMFAFFMLLLNIVIEVLAGRYNADSKARAIVTAG